MREGREPVAVSTTEWSAASTIDRFGGDERLVRELIALFLESCPCLVDNLRARMRENDLAGLGRAAHALKGSIANFTSDGAAATALDLERLCATGRADAAAVTLQRLEHEVSRLVAAMRAFESGASTCAS